MNILYHVVRACVIGLILILTAFTSFAQCANADFSSGDFSNWTGTWGFGTPCISKPIPNPYQNNGFNQGANNAAPNSSPQKNHFIMTGGNDPILQPWGYNLPVVFPGRTYSARIGNTHADGNGESITYSFVVTANNCNFTYHYAVVIQQATDLTHNSAGSQPYFNIKMTDASNNPITCAAFQVDGSTAPTIGGFTLIPGSVTGGDPVLYKPWTSVFIPLNAYIGQTVKITFTTRSCYPCTLGICCGGSHYSYAYVSAECAPLEIISSSPTVCGGQNVTLTGPAGAATYSWSGPGVTAPTNAQQCVITQPGHYHLDMTTFGSTPCNFSIDTVIAANPSNPSASFTAASACAGSPVSFTDLSTPAGQITNWSWDFDNNGTVDDITQNPSHTFATAGTYPVKLTVKWPPCIADTTINVVVTAASTSTFTAASPVCATQNTTITYTGNAPANATYNWAFDGGTIVSGSGQGPYQINWSAAGTKNVTLTVNSNGCTSAQTTVPVTVTPFPGLVLTPDTSVCPGGSVTLTAGGAVSYNWSPPAGLNTTSGAAVVATPATNTTYTVTGTASTCTVTGTINVVVNAVPVSTFTASSPVCAAQNSTITFTGTASGAAIYNWSFNGGNVVSGTGRGPYQVNWAGAGVKSISLTITDKGCVSSPTNVQVTVNPYPTASFTTTNPVCVGQSSAITYTGTGTGAANYNWGFDGGTVTAGTGQGPYQVNWATAGNKHITLTVTENGCASPVTDSVIIVNAIPTSAFVAAQQVCALQNNAITYTGTAGQAATYTWNFGGGTVASGSGQGPYQVYWLAAGTVNISLTVSENGCTGAPTSVPVTVNAIPTVSAGNDVSFCSGDSAAIGAAATAGYIYNWSPTYGLSNATIANPMADGTNTGTVASVINYTVTASYNNCSATDSVIVTINPVPVASFTPPAGQCLAGNSFNFVSAGSFLPSATAAWDFGANATPQNSTALNATTSFLSAGNQTVTLVLTENGCAGQPVTGTVDVYPMPQILFTADTFTGCENLQVCFTNNSVVNGAATYQWSFGDGNTSAAQAPCNIYNSPGVYTVGLKVTSGDGCKTDTTVAALITVVPDPKAVFTVSATSIQLPENTIDLSNESENAITYLWTFGNAGNSTSFAPPVTFADSGTYPIILRAYNQFGCVDSAQQIVTVVPPNNFFIPNIFTPNGDGNNDLFYIESQAGVRVIQFQVFDRWGEKVHDGPYPWDGTYRGKPCQPGVYIYRFDLGLAKATEAIHLKGSVTLFR